MDMARSVAVVALQPYICIKDEISPPPFWEQAVTETPLMLLTLEIQHITGQDSTGRGSNHQLMLMTDWKITLFLPGLLVTGREDGDHEGLIWKRGQQGAEEKKVLLKMSFCPWHPISSNTKGTREKSFQQSNDTEARVCTLNTTQIELSIHCHGFHAVFQQAASTK